MLSYIFFGFGMLGFIIFSYVAKLHKFKGTRLKMRMHYGLGASLFFTLLFVFQSDGEMEVMVKGLLLGLILSIPLYYYSKKWMNKRIDGATILYERSQYKQNLKEYLLWSIFSIILVTILSAKGLLEQILESTRWLFLGLCFSWFIAQVLILFYINKLEKKLGAPIIEDEK